MDDLPRRLRDGYHSLSGRPTVEEAADRIEQLEAELAELRALKAKVDGCSVVVGAMWTRVHSADGDSFYDVTELLAWLRGTEP